MPLLSCPARESGLQTLAFFEQQHGFLTPRATEHTDAQGRFRFQHLAGVSFSVWAKAAGYGVAMRQRAAPGEPVELYLPALRSLTGQVVDDAGQPVPGAHVYAVSRRTALPDSAVAGGQGFFTLDGLGEGPFYIVASAEGFLPAVEPQVEAGPQPVRLQLTPARTLEVKVVHNGSARGGHRAAEGRSPRARAAHQGRAGALHRAVPGRGGRLRRGGEPGLGAAHPHAGGQAHPGDGGAGGGGAAARHGGGRCGPARAPARGDAAHGQGRGDPQG